MFVSLMSSTGGIRVSKIRGEREERPKVPFAIARAHQLTSLGMTDNAKGSAWKGPGVIGQASSAEPGTVVLHPKEVHATSEENIESRWAAKYPKW